MKKNLLSPLIILIVLCQFTVQVFAGIKLVSKTNRNTLNDTSRINALNELSRINRNTYYEKSWSYAIQAKQESESLHYNFGLAKSLSNLGALCISKGKTLDALKYYDESLNIFKNIGDKKSIANTLNNIGVVYEQQNELEDAVNNYVQALEILRKLQDKKGIAACLNNIGNIYKKQGNQNMALKYFLESLEIKKDLKEPLMLLQTLNNIGAVYFSNNEFEKSQEYFFQCLKIAQQLNDSINLVSTYCSLGNTFLRINKPDDANVYFNKALTIAKLRGDSLGMIDAYYDLGLMFTIKKENKTALTNLIAALNLAESLRATDKLASIYKYLSEIYETQNDLVNALKYHQLFSNELQRELQGNIVPEAVAEYDIRQREEHITDLKQLVAKKQFLIIILIFLFILFSMTVFFIYSRYKLKQKIKLERTLAAQEKLHYKAIIEAQEQERKRIAGDLHDSLGYMLSTAKLNMSGLEDLVATYSLDEKKLMNNAIELIDIACNEVRVISHNLMPGALIKLGLSAGVKDLIRKVNESNKLKVDLSITGLEQRMTENIEISVYRIIQELVNNMVKHSEATEGKILLELRADKLIVQANDNGKGIDIEKLKQVSGIGWKNINSRTTMLNGTIDIHSDNTTGTKINIELPADFV